MRRYANLLVRDVEGVLLLDKPSGLSSRFFSNRIKKIFYAKKVGHVGTLDPIATGMLPICFGKSTKFSESLLQFDKKYTVLVKLGESTNTFDANGIINHIAPVKFNEEQLEQCLNAFKGKSYQIPPMFSSIKYNGVPLYKYARRGIDIPRKPRVIYVYDLYILNIKSNDIIELSIQCSKGTYVRSIVNDIGKYLGCGAHVIGLRRLKFGQFFLESSMINIQNLEYIFCNNFLNDFEVLNKLDKFLISSNELNYLMYHYS